MQINETEWTATAAYYARYFALYALLANHDILQQKLVDDIEEAKQTRIDAQYYVATAASKTQTLKNAEKARKFVLKIEQTIENTTTEQINTIRTELKKAHDSGQK
jgi:hypothetical protein